MATFEFYKQKGSTYESVPCHVESFRGKTAAKVRARQLSRDNGCRIKYQSSPNSKHYVHYSDPLNGDELNRKYGRI